MQVPKLRSVFVVAACIALAPWSCFLNPQPEPPGAAARGQDEFGTGGAAGAGASEAGIPTSDDSGSVLSPPGADAGARDAASPDGGAGDAGPAGDASQESSSEAGDAGEGSRDAVTEDAAPE